MEAAAAFALYAAGSYAVLQRVNSEVSAPYMDEIFHVPQAQRYCAGDFATWDPKLTTPPGLYLASLALRFGQPCTLRLLRLTNWLLSLLLFWTVHSLVITLHRRLPPMHAGAATLVLMLFPVSFFFHHMYYTDTASLLCVLLAYTLSLRGQHAAAAAAGLAALWMRQTNVVWVALIGALAAVRVLQMRGFGGAADMQLVQLGRGVVACWRPIARVLAPYAAVVTLFGAFVVANRGIVLGDRANHQAGTHVPQLMYFYAYLGAMAAPTVAYESRGLVHTVLRRPVRNLLAGGAVAAMMTIGVRWFTVEHPFLLSDNRHYPFYLWKNLFRRHWLARYLAIPAYACSMRAVHATLRAPPLWQLAWAACTAAVLVPSPLLEFRYFTVPFFFARLHMPLALSARTAAELAGYVLINAATIWMFLNRPFTWDSEPGKLQRFMW
ncbi:glucosyltransferase [Coemansia sp. RSA 2706]|nr:glucosyltransferase [Coemansia sp. RSA 2711]KAJ2306705.1 glucosyltransferase [Coemansia sp. RSA 2706]KAJ2321914.1 glucosyltransferase [Coemansia sp. RSA 2704]